MTIKETFLLISIDQNEITKTWGIDNATTFSSIVSLSVYLDKFSVSRN